MESQVLASLERCPIYAVSHPVHPPLPIARSKTKTKRNKKKEEKNPEKLEINPQAIVLLRRDRHRLRHHLHHLRRRLRNSQVSHCHFLMRSPPAREAHAEHSLRHHGTDPLHLRPRLGRHHVQRYSGEDARLYGLSAARGRYIRWPVRSGRRVCHWHCRRRGRACE